MKCKASLLGWAVAAFGLGILLATFLPYSWLVWILALLIVAAGVLLIIS